MGFKSMVFSLFSKHPQNVYTEKKFAEIYLQALSNTYPDAKFNLNGDLIIIAKKGDVEYKHYIDNAYIAYKAEPDSIKDIIGRYVASTSDLYLGPGEPQLENIIPVIKPIDYLEKINPVGSDNLSSAVITEKYNDQLIIVYAEDSKHSITYLTEENFKGLAIQRDELKQIALQNFEKILPNIQRHGEHGLYMITIGGDYEASLVLLPSIWTKENFPVEGDFVIAVPNRDMLLITGSNNISGIEKIKKIASDSYNTGSYIVSEFLYKWTGNKFELFT